MQPDDEAPLTLSKWPFYLGDILLVATALAIAMLGEWQLSDWQVASCVISVALGAAIFVLPFVVEYCMRLREEADDRSSETRLLQGHLQKAEAALIACGERIEALESDSGAAQRYELLAAAVDQKLGVAAQTVAGLAQEVAAIEAFKSEHAAAFSALKEQVDGLNAGVEQSTTTEALDALKQSLEAFETRLSQAAAPIESIESRLKALEFSAATPAQAAPEPIPSEPAQARSPRVQRQRRKSDAGLLHRAIQEKQDSSSSAVSRIIDSKVKPKKAARQSVKKEEAPVEAPEPVADAGAEVQEVSVPSGVDALPDVVEVSLGAELIEDATLLESAAVDSDPDQPERELSAPEKTESVEVVPTAEDRSAKETQVVDAEPVEAAPEDLFGEVAKPVARRARTKKNDAVFTVNILIGIGNKPYLRGSGGGLNWEAGVPMEFEEIGKWRWVAPADLDGSVELQVFRNDEDADRKGRHVLEAGQKLEVTPVF